MLRALECNAALRRFLLAAVTLAALLLTAPKAHAHPEGLPGIVRLSVAGESIDVEWELAPDDVALLDSRATSRADYFRDHFAVAGCDFQAAPSSRTVLDGRFSCERDLDQVSISSDLLLDLDRRYRTLVVVLSDGDTARVFLGDADRRATVRLTGDIDVASDPAGTPSGSDLPSLERRFIAVIEQDLSVAATLAGLAGALIVGAVHALSPGHGKSIAAAYLVGANGRPIHALVLGATVAAMHSASVLLLGALTWWATETVAPGDVLDVLRPVTAIGVLLVGIYLAVTRSRGGGHHHHHDHHDDPWHDHDHARPFSRRGLIALGLSGGLLPSPAALVAVLAGFSANRLPLALALVLAFSIGLAAAVTVAGLAVVRGRELIGRRFDAHRVAHIAPVVAAYVVLAVGIVLTASVFT